MERYTLMQSLNRVVKADGGEWLDYHEVMRFLVPICRGAIEQIDLKLTREVYTKRLDEYLRGSDR